MATFSAIGNRRDRPEDGWRCDAVSRGGQLRYHYNTACDAWRRYTYREQGVQYSAMSNPLHVAIDAWERAVEIAATLDGEVGRLLEIPIRFYLVQAYFEAGQLAECEKMVHVSMNVYERFKKTNPEDCLRASHEHDVLPIMFLHSRVLARRHDFDGALKVLEHIRRFVPPSVLVVFAALLAKIRACRTDSYSPTGPRENALAKGPHKHTRARSHTRTQYALRETR